MPNEHPLDHLRAAMVAIHKDGNGAYLLTDGEGAVALVTRNLRRTDWEQELAASALAVLMEIRDAIRRNIEEGMEGEADGQIRSAISYELTESPTLDEVIRLAMAAGKVGVSDGE